MKRVVLVFLFAVMTLGLYAQQGASSVGLSVGYALDSEILQWELIIATMCLMMFVSRPL